MNDQLICGMCRGEKVIRKPVANLVKVDNSLRVIV